MARKPYSYYPSRNNPRSVARRKNAISLAKGVVTTGTGAALTYFKTRKPRRGPTVYIGGASRGHRTQTSRGSSMIHHIKETGTFSFPLTMPATRGKNSQRQFVFGPQSHMVANTRLATLFKLYERWFCHDVTFKFISSCAADNTDGLVTMTPEYNPTDDHMVVANPVVNTTNNEAFEKDIADQCATDTSCDGSKASIVSRNCTCQLRNKKMPSGEWIRGMLWTKPSKADGDPVENGVGEKSCDFGSLVIYYTGAKSNITAPVTIGTIEVSYNITLCVNALDAQGKSDADAAVNPVRYVGDGNFVDPDAEIAPTITNTIPVKRPSGKSEFWDNMALHVYQPGVGTIPAVGWSYCGDSRAITFNSPKESCFPIPVSLPVDNTLISCDLEKPLTSLASTSYSSASALDLRPMNSYLLARGEVWTGITSSARTTPIEGGVTYYGKFVLGCPNGIADTAHGAPMYDVPDGTRIYWRYSTEFSIVNAIAGLNSIGPYGAAGVTTTKDTASTELSNRPRHFSLDAAGRFPLYWRPALSDEAPGASAEIPVTVGTWGGGTSYVIPIEKVYRVTCPQVPIELEAATQPLSEADTTAALYGT